MAVAGTFPEQGVRVALDLRSVDENHARYGGDAYTPTTHFMVSLQVEVATGKSVVELGETTSREGHEVTPLETGDLAFIKQLGTQLWRQAREGTWARRVQRWRGPK